ncbi:MAG: class I SAM-dependent methyltransferase [Verrucomicrobiales bacterium]|nr:class I SAM-dependent methyltransferase [Verrucomicrobiales bacterium]
MNPAQEHNRRAWDDRVRRHAWYIDTATDQDFNKPLAVIDPCGWLGGDVTGKRLLCLAAGGGRHSVLFAAAGARVTVVDLSPKALELDRQIAAKRNLEVRIIEASMDNLSMIEPASFDMAVQPVSTCYVPEVGAVYREVARVLIAGGLYISQHKQPANLQADARPTGPGYLLLEPYYRGEPLPPAQEGWWHREAGTIEFLHRWDQLLGDLCKSGFVIEDVAEPRHADARAAPASFGHRSCFVPPYIKIKARRTSAAPSASGTKLWTPV